MGAGVRLLAFALAGCSGGASTSSTAPQASPSTLADAAARQRTCVASLRDHLQTLAVSRVDAFLAATLNGVVVCDAASGLAHLPTREVSTWLGSADGRKHPGVRVPPQPSAFSHLPSDPTARVAYQRTCTRWLRRYLPATIAHDGDDPDTAATAIFDAMEECDAAAGFATISRADLARIITSKNLN